MSCCCSILFIKPLSQQQYLTKVILKGKLSDKDGIPIPDLKTFQWTELHCSDVQWSTDECLKMLLQLVLLHASRKHAKSH